jgi:hypothetical protein
MYESSLTVRLAPRLDKEKSQCQSLDFLTIVFQFNIVWRDPIMLDVA